MADSFWRDGEFGASSFLGGDLQIAGRWKDDEEEEQIRNVRNRRVRKEGNLPLLVMHTRLPRILSFFPLSLHILLPFREE